MEIAAYIAFGVYAVIIMGGSLMAINCRSLVRALVGLIATLVGVAGMYLLLNSPFLAFMQLLIYVGAICVLIFFALALGRADADGDEAEQEQTSPPKTGLAILAALLPLALVAPVLLLHPVASRFTPANVSLMELGHGLMQDYALAFELISMVLLVSMAGAILLVWERRNR